MSEIDISRIKKIVQILSDTSHLDETELSILLALMKNSKITNGELAKLLDYKDGNSVAYHTKIMQKEGVIGRYTLIPNWKRVGLGTEFIVLAEAENEEQLRELCFISHKDHAKRRCNRQIYSHSQLETCGAGN